MDLVEQVVTIKTPRGLHATPACMLAQTAMRFDSAIRVEYKGKIINCKSLVRVVALGAGTGDKLILSAVGEDAKEAIAALVDLVEVRNFDGE
jgi:phosphotransferase system HPr (HPr) family protein